jgi:hypothetical protein
VSGSHAQEHTPGAAEEDHAALWDVTDREIESDRKSEFRLIPKAILALAVVAALVVVRQLVLG